MSLALLTAVMPHLPLPRATELAPCFDAACVDPMLKPDITTPLRIAAFIAQLAHESAEFRYFEEIWGPTPAQLRYEGRKDLGNIFPGDGAKFKGHGPIQITGRLNHEACGKALGLDLANNPRLLVEPIHGFQAAAWFWSTHKLNALADKGDFHGVTQVINGGQNGAASREAYYAKALLALGVTRSGV